MDLHQLRPFLRTYAPVMPQDAPLDIPVLMSQYSLEQATGTRADAEQRATVEAGGLVEGHVVLWANTAFESRSNDNITAQQEEVRREVGRVGQRGMGRRVPICWSTWRLRQW